jgi:predicted NBD/HSP70 family sugar kinase
MREFLLVPPKFSPPLEPGFRPAALANRRFREAVQGVGHPLVIGLARNSGEFSRYETLVFPEDHAHFEANFVYIERLVKFLLWARGGHTIYIGGSERIADFIRQCYSSTGPRRFDFQFMGDQVYERPFRVVACQPSEVPPANESGRPLGGHLGGCRIGFDLGASDRKVSAVIDGNVVFSEEVIWEPRKHADPNYHYTEILQAIQTAAAKMPRVDAVGGSSAGIIINNRPMVASLFRAVPEDQFGAVRELFNRLGSELGVPLVVINDGDVTALAGAMSLEENGVLGIAMGSSEAAGYVDPQGHIRGWLSELAFAPVDFNPAAALDDWSGDCGVGASYFSQQCVFRLAPKAGLDLPEGVSDAERLVFVQDKLEKGHAGAENIWRSMGIFLGYAIPHYADFYDMKHVLVLGRCTSGRGGTLILENALEVLKNEFPDLAARIHVQLPDEKSRRVGQSIAAASLPDLRK